MKQIKMILAVILVLGLMAAPALAAGTVYVNHLATGGAVKIAREALGVARTVVASSTGAGLAQTSTVPVGYVGGTPMITTDTFRVDLTGGINFPATSIRLCLASTTASSTEVTNTTPTSGAVNVSFRPGTTIPSGALVYLSNAACTGAVAAADLALNVPANTPLGDSTISATIVGIETSTPKTLVSVLSEYTASINTTNLVQIDYLAATTGNPKDGTHFVKLAPGTNVIAGIGDKIMTVASSTGYDYKASGYGITYTQSINLTDTGSWASVNRVYSTNKNAATDCSFANNNASNIAPVGTVTLTPTGSTAFNGSVANGSQNVTLCVEVNGTSVLTRRTISGSVYYTPSAGGLSVGTFANQVMMLWAPNGYQAFNPYMYVGADQTVDVFNRFYNNSSENALVFVEVFPADGAAVQVIQLAGINANTAGTYWGSDIGVLAGLPVGTSYAARFTVTATPTMVNGVSFFKRTTGERQMPLYKTNDNTYLMQ